MSVAKVALGRRLFFDSQLSVTGRYSCASCHDPGKAYSDGRDRAVGATGATLARGAMSLTNVAYNISFGWTKPELQSLEAQMLEPLLNEHPVELGLSGRQAEVCERLAADSGYRAAFAESFPQGARGEHGAAMAASAQASGATVPSVDAATLADTAANAAGSPVTFDNLVKAIAAFERTLIYGRSPFDRYVFEGEHDALSAQAKRGMQLFYSARAACGTCHSGFNFDGNWRDSQGETGKPSFANNGASDQPMKVPTLRNIALTSPYMHDGRYATLDAVLDHYERVARDPAADAKLRSFDLSATERADLLAFLDTLTDPAGAADQPGR